MATTVLSHCISASGAMADSTMRPKTQAAMISGEPVKEIFGRPGTWTRDRIQFAYHTTIHGIGMMKQTPMRYTRVRQTNSQMPKSIEIAPAPAVAYPPG